MLSPQDEIPEYCPHVEFVYVSEAGEFTHITPELDEKVEAWRSAAEGAGEDESEDEFDPVAALAAGLDGDDRFIWESPEPGRCGEPGTITVWVGFRCQDPAH